MNDFEQESYHKLSKIKDKILKPIAVVLTWFKITANHISAIGIALMLLFVYYIRKDLIIATILLIASISFDLLDGVVARHQKKQNDRGKFVDMIADVLNTMIFSVGIAYGQIVNPTIMIPYAYFMLMSKSLRVYINSQNLKSDWQFKPVAGFLPNFINQTGYIAVIAHVIGMGKGIVTYIFIVGTTILVLDSIGKFWKIMNKKIKDR